MMLMFEEGNVVGVVLEEEDGLKLKYQTSTITTSRLSGKSTNAT